MQGTSHEELSSINATEEVLIDNDKDDTKSTIVEDGLGISGDISMVISLLKR